MDAINDEERWDPTQEPFVIKNRSITIRGDKHVFTVETNEKQEGNILRGIAKIALNALIYNLEGEKMKEFTEVLSFLASSCYLLRNRARC